MGLSDDADAARKDLDDKEVLVNRLLQDPERLANLRTEIARAEAALKAAKQQEAAWKKEEAAAWQALDARERELEVAAAALAARQAAAPGGRAAKLAAGGRRAAAAAPPAEAPAATGTAAPLPPLARC